MREPMAWGGLCVWLGALTWQGWQPPLDALLVGVWFMGALALAGRRFPAAVLAWPVGAFLAGAAAAAVMPEPPDLPEQAVVQGVLTSASGYQATASTDVGRLTLRFSEPAPRAGTRIAAWTTPATASPQLPGSFGVPEPARKVRRFVVLGAQQEDPRLERFEQAEHGGLLRALATGDRSGVPEDTAALLRRTGTAHLLAISGLHIGLVAGMGWGLAWLLSRPLTWLRSPWPARMAPALGALAIAVGYGSLVGWPVSARRASGGDLPLHRTGRWCAGGVAGWASLAD